MNEEQSGKTSAISPRLVWPAALVIVAVLALVAVDRACRAARMGQESTLAAVEKLGNTATGLAEGFKTGTITTTFVAAIPRMVAGEDSKLELVAYEATESFSRSDDRRILYDLVPLGTTVTEIRVPVTYRYHLRLDEPWQLEVNEHSCIVHAPRIRATQPPAIHTDRLEKRIESGWLRFDDDEQMSALERSITPTISARARDPHHLELVRERCRLEVADFVRSWLLAEDHWREDRFSSVTVIFADETAVVEETHSPTLRLENARH